MDSIAPSSFLRVKLPCNAPPWGTTEAVDLFTGKQVWDVPLGTLVPGQQTGSINLGGPMITAGGLVFTSAGMDLYLHAFDIETGKELWKYLLPAGGQATPMTYIFTGQTVCRDRSRRAWQAGHQTGRLCACLRAAVDTLACDASR